MLTEHISSIVDSFPFLWHAKNVCMCVIVPLENFTSDQVPESGKETCRNWFYKIASIRELLPRLYPFTETWAGRDWARDWAGARRD